MKICIWRGAKQIGGTCIEVESQGKRLVLDIGQPFDILPMVEGLNTRDYSLGCFVGIVVRTGIGTS